MVEENVVRKRTLMSYVLLQVFHLAYYTDVICNSLFNISNKSNVTYDVPDITQESRQSCGHAFNTKSREANKY